MVKLQSSQSGIAHVAGIVIVLVILIAGFVGWKVWDANKNTNTTATDTAEPTQNGTPTAYLEIKELGVKLRLTNDTKDMTYHMNSDGNAILSSTSLAKEEPKCAADYAGSDGVGSVSNFTDPEGKDKAPVMSTNIESYPDAVAVNDKYYFIQTGQSFCVNVGTKNNPTDAAYMIESTLVGALRTDIKLEKL